MTLDYSSSHAKKVKAELLRISKLHWAAREVRKKKGTKTDEDKKKEHASSSEPFKAILSKKGGYSQRAHDYLLKDSARNEVYHDFPHTRQVFTVSLAKGFEKDAKFPGKIEANFNPKAKSDQGEMALQKFPYSWRAHHMIPGSAFYAKTNTGEIITDKHRDLLKQTEYDINHGHNIIDLPAKNDDVPIHSLIQHPSDHRAYTEQVMNEMKAIADDIQKILDQKPKDHENIVYSCFEELKTLEDGCWDFIVGLSRASVSTVIAGSQLDDDTVKYSSSSGKTSYAWGALA